MQKYILKLLKNITLITLLGLGLVNCSNSSKANKEKGTETKSAEPEIEFFYDIHALHHSTITKVKLLQAKTLEDLIPEDVYEGNTDFREIRIGLFPRKGDRSELGDSELFTQGQLALLKTAEYSNHIFIEAFCKRINEETDQLVDKCFVDYMTVVPETQAKFKNGNAALLKYLKEKGDHLLNKVDSKKLTIGRTSFTITKDGTVENVRFESTSGFENIDNAMIDLISNLPGDWIPAKDSNGNATEQELVYVYTVAGC